MKLLLDENLPVKLKYRFIDKKIEAYTVRDMNWLGKENGELLTLMLQNNFTSFLTMIIIYLFSKILKIILYKFL